jgi:hypothetical protein
MTPQIDGIALYPLNFEVTNQKTGLVYQVNNTNDTFSNVSCSLDSNQDIPLETLDSQNKILQRGQNWKLICAVQGGGDGFHIIVGATLSRIKNVFVNLDDMSLNREIKGDDGSLRAIWDWPNQATYTEIDRTYTLVVTLKQLHNIGSPISISKPQTFDIKFIQKKI